jgi:Tol biopolymer transport system component
MPGGNGFNFDWSPDGTQFAWTLDGVLRIRRADGSLTTFSNLSNAASLDWEYVGDRIAVRCQPIGGQPLGLYSVNSQTGASSLIKANVGGNKPIIYSGPRWSPDGQHLVAMKVNTGPQFSHQIVRMTPTGANETVLLSGTSGQQTWPHRWSSDVQQ